MSSCTINVYNEHGDVLGPSGHFEAAAKLMPSYLSLPMYLPGKGSPEKVQLYYMVCFQQISSGHADSSVFLL